MRASDLTHRIVLQRPTETRDAFGDPVQTWTQLGQVWAGIDWRSGGESLQGERAYAEVPVSIKVRRSTDTVSLREKDRALVQFGGTSLKTALGTSTGTSVVVTTPGVFPPENEFCVRVGTELMLVASGAGTSASPYVVTRGAYGTTASVHQAGVAVLHMVPLDIVATSLERSAVELTGVRGEVRTV